ncbi:TPA: hypothetical protein DDW35_14015 [Candidatus Sumerlaeota bacterium]|nr:hypothetical protein [Candidatus Sumerlaeota bacterium]
MTFVSYSNSRKIQKFLAKLENAILTTEGLTEIAADKAAFSRSLEQAFLPMEKLVTHQPHGYLTDRTRNFTR